MTTPHPARWQRKVDALLRLAEDQRGTPEGDLAREKLRRILRRHPEARAYEPLQAFTLRDVAYMKRHGISTGGSWTGANLGEAIALMVADYRRRIVEFQNRPRPSGKFLVAGDTRGRDEETHPHV